MKKLTVLLLAMIVVGCATPIPKSTNYCAKGETENCRPWTASEKAGAGSRGHTEQMEEPK